MTAHVPVRRQSALEIAREIEAYAKALRSDPALRAAPVRVSQADLQVHAAEQRCIASMERANRAYEAKHLGEVK